MPTPEELAEMFGEVDYFLELYGESVEEKARATLRRIAEALHVLDCACRNEVAATYSLPARVGHECIRLRNAILAKLGEKK